MQANNAVLNLVLMKQFITRYWRRIVFYAVLLTLCILFIGDDRNHYLQSDYKAFLPATHIALIVILAVWLCIIVIIGRKHIENIGQALAGILFLAIKFAFVYFFFHILFSGICFFINRQYHGGPVARQYVVNRDTTGQQPYFIKSITNGQLLYVGNLPANYQIPGSNKRVDTITITFTKGLFGVPYLDKK
jgi:hypothetical protein